MFNDAEGEIYRLQEGNRELKAENKRLLEAFQRERDEKEACVRHSEKTIERLREAGWCLVVDDPGGVVSWINGHLNYMGTVPTNVAIQIENYKDAAVKEAAEKIRAENKRLREAIKGALGEEVE